MEWISTNSVWVYVLIVVFSAFITYWTYWKQPRTIFSRAQRWILSILRFMLFCVLGFILFSPFLKFNFTREEKPLILVAIDKSTSVGKGLGGAVAKALLDDVYQNIEEYSEDFDIDTIAFGAEVRPELYGPFQDPKTDIFSLSSHISDKYYESHLQEILLITDGYATEGASPFESDYLLDQPISVLAVGDTGMSPDYAVTLLQMPSVVLAENEVVVNAEFACNQSSLQRATVQVLVDGQVVQRDAIKFSGSNDLQNRQYSLAIKSKGQHNVCLQIRSEESEANMNNNSRCSTVEISQESIEVTLLYRSPHPDVGVIDRALSSLENIKISKTKALSTSPDVVIAHNISDPNTIEKIKNSGAGVWVISGIQSSPQNWQALYPNLRVVPSSTELQPRMRNGFSVFDIQFVPNTWVAYLPPLVNKGMALASRQSSDVFLENSRSTPVVAYERSAQHMLLSNGEGLWRWRMAEKRETGNSVVFDEWLRQSILFLRPSANKNRFEVHLNKTQYQLGENVVWTAQYYNDNGALDNDGEVKINISGGASTKEYRMNKSSNGFALALGDLAPGLYQYSASYTHKGTSQRRKGSFTVENVDIEQAHPTANMQIIDPLIYNYGGQLLRPSQISAWWQNLAQKGYKNRLVKEERLQRMIDIRWFLFLLLFLLLAEWILRKWFGSI